MKIHTGFAQGDAEWLQVRVGKVTASEMDHLITPEFKARTGAGPHTYLCGKIAEAWRGQALPGFTSWATEQGQLLEDEARKWYAFEFNETLRNVAFVEHDDGRCGCSPDALIGDDGGLELKAPEPTNHVRYLLDGVLPKDYVAQVHMSLYVTGRKWWKFVSYRRKFPPFVLTIERDEAIMEKIGNTLADFYAKFDAAMATLKEISK
jgi:hypothetical protein